MIIKQASDLHFTYVKNTPELREAFIAKCNEFGIRGFGFGGENYLEVYSDGYDEFEICGTDDLEPKSKKLTMADLTGIPTETPEEKEVLDGIESVGEVEWKNGDDVDAYGKPYKYVGLDPFNENLCICLANQDDDPECFSIDVLKKPETPQQREDRERLEAAYDLYVHIQSVREKLSCKFDWFFSPGMEETRLRFLAIVDKTNYRKEKTHGTN